MNDKHLIKPWFAILLLMQLVVAGIAIATDIIYFKIGVAGLGIIALMYAHKHHLNKVLDVWVVAIAFGASMVGDCFLSSMNGNSSMFMIGIAFYLLAHIGYLLFSVLNGIIKRGLTVGILIAFLIFYFLALYPSIPDKLLALIVLFYLVVSCVSVGAAFGIKACPKVKWPFVIGIALVLFSDTIISLKEFVKYNSLDFMILPTYYLAQIGITLGLYYKSLRKEMHL
ncbi:lysoplasmalogenase [Maribacter sp. HTCC2170]|uniref:lysoplasmalogenase n=1 Tax=Maribacter sp. (strain HTCC2170 / KCCM 42371) TaxID=313603 RepID=UPI00006AFD30|nr:lysoplasmalogenase [Maribacter sp. HTCC2170]EAR01460.1 hypothetical protein FB2170_12086 [Maribacter sp. HTCC2170]